jgi:UDP-glucose 4-epimerase
VNSSSRPSLETGPAEEARETVVVTGGSGRLGRSVVAVLAEAGFDVVSIDRDPSAGLPARQIQLDLRDSEATAALFCDLAPGAVVHLAAIAVPHSAPDPEIFSVNTTLAFSVIAAAAASGATRCLIASSPTVIGYGAPGGWVPDYLPIDEDHPTAPWNGYSVSKEAVEGIVRMTARRLGEGFRIGAFRPCFVISPEEWRGAPTQQGHTLVQRLDEPRLAAAALFNYVDARDAGDFVAAWLAAAPTIPNGSVFFVGAADALARRPLSELLPEYLPQTAGHARSLSGAAAAFSIERARRLTGWQPKRNWRTELVTESGSENLPDPVPDVNESVR